MIQVKDCPNWFRKENGSLVNTDEANYKAFLARKRVATSKHTEQEQIKQEIGYLKSEIDEINNKMNLLLSLLQGK